MQGMPTMPEKDPEKVYGMNDPEIGDEYEMYKVSEVDAVLAEKDKQIEELKKKLGSVDQ